MKIQPNKIINNIAKQSAIVVKEIASEKVNEKSADLPRFSSPEMVMARALNKIAIRNTKAPKKFTFPKASAQDLKRLTSNTIADSYSRVTWTNPKDGKIYHILKESELPDGNIAVRILNEDGSFLKNANIKPKKIIIIDNFDHHKNMPYGLIHGELVSSFLKRNNPFANIETINVGFSFPTEEKFLSAFRSVLCRLKNGEKIDYISCSKGANCFTSVKNMRGTNEDLNIIEQVAKKGVRLLFAAGNSKDNATNQILLLVNNVEGVGSLSSKTHKISDFSGSRNSFFTQHYEVGEYNVIPTKYGVNMTGIPGTDIIIDNPKFKQEVENNILIGKTKERVDKLLDKIKSEIKEVQQKKLDLMHGIINSKALAELEQRQDALEQRKIKLINLMASTPLENGKYESPKTFWGTSFSTPVRTAKLALTDMLQELF